MSAQIKGDPFGESRVLVSLQDVLFDIPGALTTARGMSHFGEHALGWFALSGLGYAVEKNPDRRPEWVAMGVSAFVAHAASVVIKRVIRRPRPHASDIKIGVGTPSRLSFPSSHATSSTAALVSLSDITGRKMPLLGVPAMALSRMVLGVHYPTDVVSGSLIGFATAKIVRHFGVKKK
ncbi:phosphatase PAP2 family protein [Corynebacterium anserum]|uniref:Phosphatase PAP2 family protein n=1 Tax=Corynebacterium anserum TaxID=2684406 RepID=A0A7G7YLM4_9CORY|nr:phosphatase PAP2 family protein [Corynebacterium anserum]MBC2681448.1 phosphatase PAP2 family protein [Corynebacterium anserum]QNH95394.1 phosphatase PAP2 family protein [Corynebacterium anserum]